jgi:hypothetical protein
MKRSYLMKNKIMNKHENIDNELYFKYGKYDVLDVAEYVLQFCEKELLYPISNSKLQKILYFIFSWQEDLVLIFD